MILARKLTLHELELTSDIASVNENNTAVDLAITDATSCFQIIVTGFDGQNSEGHTYRRWMWYSAVRMNGFERSRMSNNNMTDWQKPGIYLNESCTH
jgi:hypothetical protein